MTGFNVAVKGIMFIPSTEEARCPSLTCRGIPVPCCPLRGGLGQHATPPRMTSTKPSEERTHPWSITPYRQLDTCSACQILKNCTLTIDADHAPGSNFRCREHEYPFFHHPRDVCSALELRRVSGTACVKLKSGVPYQCMNSVKIHVVEYQDFGREIP
mgnify:CR=1 FL=1